MSQMCWLMIGSSMTRAGFEYALDKHARAAAANCPTLSGRTISRRQLRHSCAFIMLQATRDIRKAALWLGHADVRTTEVYRRMDPSEMREAVEAVAPSQLRRGRFNRRGFDALAKSGLSGRAEAAALSSRGGADRCRLSRSTVRGSRPGGPLLLAGLARAGLVPATAPPTFFP